MGSEKTRMTLRHVSPLFLIVAVLSIAACTFHSDPMKGWTPLGSFSNTEVPETIKQDARAFFQTLPKVERICSDQSYDVSYYEDGAGQHAVVLQTSHDGEHWHYALVYGPNNRRIKLLKYSTGSYMS